MATGVSCGKMQLAAFNGASTKTTNRCKNHTKISYASQVIANFVPNFVAMAIGVSRGKMQLAAFNSPSRKPLYRYKNLIIIIIITALRKQSHRFSFFLQLIVVELGAIMQRTI